MQPDKYGLNNKFTFDLSIFPLNFIFCFLDNYALHDVVMARYHYQNHLFKLDDQSPEWGIQGIC